MQEKSVQGHLFFFNVQPFPPLLNIILSTTFYNFNKIKIVTNLSKKIIKNFILLPNALSKKEPGMCKKKK